MTQTTKELIDRHRMHFASPRAEAHTRCRAEEVRRGDVRNRGDAQSPGRGTERRDGRIYISLLQGRV